MPSKQWWLMLGVLFMLNWASPVQAATHGQTEISVGFYETDYHADQIVPERVIPSGDKPYLVKSAHTKPQYNVDDRRAGDGDQSVIGGHQYRQVGYSGRLPQTSEHVFLEGLLIGMGLLACVLAGGLYQMIKQQVRGERGA